jgi:hypothetical protein
VQLLERLCYQIVKMECGEHLQAEMPMLHSKIVMDLEEEMRASVGAWCILA